jgi:hypothetical protein
LTVRGAFHPEPGDAAPDDTGTLVMLGPDEPAFWDLFTASAEYRDDHPHALDRWSKRVLSDLAAPLLARAVFPYDGPPYAPFLRWAERCGTSWSSPVGLLVHDVAGLFISFRAALLVPERLDLPVSPSKPCLSCTDHPCATAWPRGRTCSRSALRCPRLRDPYQKPARRRVPTGLPCAPRLPDLAALWSDAGTICFPHARVFGRVRFTLRKVKHP